MSYEQFGNISNKLLAYRLTEFQTPESFSQHAQEEIKVGNKKNRKKNFFETLMSCMG